MEIVINQSSHHRFRVSFALVYIRIAKMAKEKEHKTQVKELSILALLTSPSLGSEMAVGIMALLKNMVGVLGIQASIYSIPDHQNKGMIEMILRVMDMGTRFGGQSTTFVVREGVLMRLIEVKNSGPFQLAL